MKALFLIGGLLGFTIGLIFGWLERISWPSSLWHACLAAYLTGHLLRWWGRAWLRNWEIALCEEASRPAPSAPPSLPKAPKT